VALVGRPFLEFLNLSQVLRTKIKIKTKCRQLIPNLKKHPEGETKHSWKDDALHIELFVEGSLFLTTNMSLLFSSGLQIILSKQKL